MSKTPHTEANLRAAIAKMAPNQSQAIRDAYYAAVAALRNLADALESVDIENAPDDVQNALLHEHVIACEAIGAMDLSLLGNAM